jgi:hypothetical protein
MRIGKVNFRDLASLVAMQVTEPRPATPTRNHETAPFDTEPFVTVHMSSKESARLLARQERRNKSLPHELARRVPACIGERRMMPCNEDVTHLATRFRVGECHPILVELGLPLKG